MKSVNWKYTFGEILIVIIGITIAFSMNKCAEDRRDSSQRQQYLVSLKNDVEADKAELQLIVEALQKKITTIDRILPVLNTDSLHKMSVVGDIFSISNIVNFSSKDVTYQTLINSGDLKLIDDFDLKTAIEAHYAIYKVMLKDYERQENIHKMYLGDYFIYNTNFDAFTKGTFGFEDEKLLKNIIQSMNGSFNLKLKATRSGIRSCDSLLTRLKTHIE